MSMTAPPPHLSQSKLSHPWKRMRKNEISGDAFGRTRAASSLEQLPPTARKGPWAPDMSLTALTMLWLEQASCLAKASWHQNLSQVKPLRTLLWAYWKLRSGLQSYLTQLKDLIKRQLGSDGTCFCAVSFSLNLSMHWLVDCNFW